MLNITTFLDANSQRLDKKVLFNPKTGEKYTSREILSIVSEIGRNLKALEIHKGDRIIHANIYFHFLQYGELVQ